MASAKVFAPASPTLLQNKLTTSCLSPARLPIASAKALAPAFPALLKSKFTSSCVRHLSLSMASAKVFTPASPTLLLCKFTSSCVRCSSLLMPSAKAFAPASAKLLPFKFTLSCVRPSSLPMASANDLAPGTPTPTRLRSKSMSFAPCGKDFARASTMASADKLCNFTSRKDMRMRSRPEWRSVSQCKLISCPRSNAMRNVSRAKRPCKRQFTCSYSSQV
mmetsp:Transcript_30987/g.56302  ORF Transcript_30987/g.56302 Transcript_30987/m.56302 type:complete len:220 (+) Transcript_30987:125-784(+)